MAGPDGTQLHGTDRPGRLRVVALLAAVGLVVGCGLLATAVRPPWPVRYVERDASAPEPTAVSTWQPSGIPSASPDPVPIDPSGGRGLSPVLLIVAGVILAALLVSVVVVLVLRRRRSRPVEAGAVDLVSGESTQDQLPVLQRGADEATRRLFGAGEPTDLIITAWLALEEAAASSGTARSPAQTPTEFTAEVLRETGVTAEPVETLLRLYLRARFSAAGARPEDLAAARRCVGALSEAWRTYRLQNAGER